jgi:hypothetical protein
MTNIFQRWTSVHSCNIVVPSINRLCHDNPKPQHDSRHVCPVARPDHMSRMTRMRHNTVDATIEISHHPFSPSILSTALSGQKFRLNQALYSRDRRWYPSSSRYVTMPAMIENVSIRIGGESLSHNFLDERRTWGVQKSSLSIIITRGLKR